MVGDLMPLTVRQDVLEWIAAHPGLGARSAVSHFAPLAEGPERSRYVERVRMWMKRSPTRSKERAKDPKGGARVGQKAPPRPGVPVEDLVSRSATPSQAGNAADQGDMVAVARHDRRRLVQAGRATTAKQAIQGLTHGCWISGLTMGQFSLIDLITAIVERIGPADVRLSTWTTGIKDMETAMALLDSGRFRSLQILTDRSFPSRQPAYAARLVQLFGPDAVVCTQVHAKVAVLRAPGWAVTVRSSMNLNRNDRFEQFDLDEGEPLAAFYGAWFDRLRRDAGTGIDFQNSDQAAAYEAALRAPLTDEAVVFDMMAREGVEVPSPTMAAKRERKAGRADEAAPDVLSLDLFDLDPLELARAHVAIAQHGLRSAEPSSVAYVQGHRALREVMQEVSELRTAQQQKTDPVAVGTAEWLARSAEDASTCSDDELEVYVTEWLRRRSLSLHHDTSGRLSLVQAAA